MVSTLADTSILLSGLHIPLLFVFPCIHGKPMYRYMQKITLPKHWMANVTARRPPRGEPGAGELLPGCELPHLCPYPVLTAPPPRLQLSKPSTAKVLNVADLR